MRFNIKYLVAVVIAAIFCVNSNAQSLKSVLDAVKNGVSQTSSAHSGSSSVAKSLSSSKAKVSPSKLVATWTYKEPVIDFESGSLLGKISGNVAGNKLEEEIANYLSEAGIKAGDFQITFKNDSTFVSTLKGKTATGMYAISGSTIMFRHTKTSTQKISAAIKVGSTLQITFKADKLLAFIQEISSAAASEDSTLKTIATISKSYKGMNIDMSFTKAKK